MSVAAADATSSNAHAVGGRLGTGTVFAYVALAVFLGGMWCHRAGLVDAVSAWRGQSPIEFAHRALRPQDYQRDYSDAVDLMSASLPMNVYPWLARYCQIRPETTLKGFMLVEHALLALALMSLTRALRPQSPPIVGVLVAIIIMGSDCTRMDLANMGVYSTDGLYYRIADALRLLAVTAMVRGRLLTAWVLLAASFTCHPIMAGVGIAFLLGYMAVTPAKLRTRSFLTGAVLAVLIAALWSLHVGSLVSASTDAESVRIWFKTAQLTNCHWFPVRAGFLTTGHMVHVIPLLALMMLAIHYATRDRQPSSPPLLNVLSGTATLALLTLLGLLFSLQEISPSLVKLCLHRADQLAITLAMVYCVAGLWEDLVRGPSWQPVAAGALLLSPFSISPGFPLAWCLAIVYPSLRDARRFRLGKWESIVLLAMAGCCLAAVLGYAFAGYVPHGNAIAGYLGSRGMFAAACLLAVLLVFVRRPVGRFALSAKAIPAAVLLLMGTWTVRCAGSIPIHLAEMPRCEAYRQAQLWANQNTPPNTLFLVDPTIYYGWREFSERCSFGNLREWTYAWHYAMNYAAFQEGVKRLAAFGIRLDDYLAGAPSVEDEFAQCDTALHGAFYGAGAQWFLTMSQEHRIDYFVMQKPYLKADRRAELKKLLPVAYENDDFLIFAARRSPTMPRK